MRQIGEIVEGAIGRKDALRAARALKVLKRWDEAVGVHLGQRSQPERYERGTVFVACEGSAWSQELRMAKEQILKRLNEMSGEPMLFMDLRFGVRKPEKPVAEEDNAEATEEHRKKLRSMSISEIAKRRLEKWRDAAGDQ